MKRELSIETIERGLKDSDYDVRAAAMNACNGKDVPLDIIERGSKDSDWHVRTAAMKYCEKHNIPTAPYRSFDPPAQVYKKCVGDVIVVAEIPDDAEVRGDPKNKCRANKAKIVDIIGEFVGEKVGISTWNKTTTYFVGDDIEVENFDYSDEICSPGFHFFCTKEQAEKYWI